MSQPDKEYIKNNAQFIKVHHDGSIVDSDNSLLSVAKNKNISEIHPFFESLVPMLHDIEQEECMSCVNLDFDGFSGIYDVTIKHLENSPVSVIVLQDFTDHYKEYQKVAQIRNESVINSEIITLYNKQLTAEKEFKNKFLANVSHEIRTPLNGILGFLALLEKSGINEEQKGLVNIIKRSGNHLNGLIEDLLDVAKIEVGHLTIVKRKFKMAEVAKYLGKLYTAKAKEKGITFDIDLNSNVPEYVIGDKTRLQQVLINLLDNAFKFTHEGGVSLKIITNSRRGKKVNLNFLVKDTGMGIAEEDLERIFESFVQVHNSPSYGGTGLGLSITEKIVSFLGGKISAKSELGKGASFSVNMNYELELITKKPVKKALGPASYKSGKKHQVLMVEDAEVNQLLLMKLLVTRGNCYIDLATNGQEALDFVNSDTQYDLVLMDIKIPGIDGLEVAKQIRASDDYETKKLPIIAVTAFATKKDKQACKQVGMNDFISLPFEEEELFTKMARFLK